MRKLLVAMFVSSMLVACSSTPTKEQEGAKVEEAKPSAARPATPQPPPKAETQPVQPKTVQVNPLKDPSNILSKRSVYFDYDSNIVKDEFKPLITAHAKYLSQNRSAHATIQGNTDERGSREYNLALGQRRAEAVKQMMQLLGASPAQIDTTSFGEEKPRADGHDEGAWAQNRRADIVYQGE
ncbi:MAG TPA: peptidoglycan-associated lipoprotein Pal [Burkholderiales bacterium]|nr:peptidoglycan-associated lipoprotein Pal [Burkholderiales bacterium]